MATQRRWISPAIIEDIISTSIVDKENSPQRRRVHRAFRNLLGVLSISAVRII